VFVKFFIRRPVFATVCSLLIILAGAMAIPTLPIAQFPTLAPPQVTVSAFYTGANAQAVAFILGVLPLAFATGAGSEGRHSVGTTVFGGMIVSTFLNLFIIPILYVIVRSVIPLNVEQAVLRESEADD